MLAADLVAVASCAIGWVTNSTAKSYPRTEMWWFYASGMLVESAVISSLHYGVWLKGLSGKRKEKNFNASIAINLSLEDWVKLFYNLPQFVSILNN